MNTSAHHYLWRDYTITPLFVAWSRHHAIVCGMTTSSHQCLWCDGVITPILPKLQRATRPFASALDHLLSPLSHCCHGGNASDGALAHYSCRCTILLSGTVSRQPQRDRTLPSVIMGGDREDSANNRGGVTMILSTY